LLKSGRTILKSRANARSCSRKVGLRDRASVKVMPTGTVARFTGLRSGATIRPGTGTRTTGALSLTLSRALTLTLSRALSLTLTLSRALSLTLTLSRALLGRSLTGRALLGLSLTGTLTGTLTGSTRLPLLSLFVSTGTGLSLGGILSRLNQRSDYVHSKAEVAEVVIRSKPDGLIEVRPEVARHDHRVCSGINRLVPTQNSILCFGVVAESNVPEGTVDHHHRTHLRVGLSLRARLRFLTENEVLQIAQLDEGTGVLLVSATFNADVFDQVTPFEESARKPRPVLHLAPAWEHDVANL
jgi:hypothetical protein